MKNIGIVSSPLQFLNFAEYINQFKIKEYYLIVLYYKNIEIQQIEETNLIYKIQIHKKLKGIPFLQYFWIFFFSSKIKTCHTLILGSFFSDPHLYLNNCLKKKKLVVVDDGIISYSIQDYIFSKKRMIKSSLYRTILFKLFKINTVYPSFFLLFTIFDIKSNKSFITKKNDLSFFISNIKSKQINNSILIIGQPFVEHKMIDFCDYESAINDMILKFKSFKIEYYPSRKEIPFFFRKLKSVNIINPSSNIETYLLKNTYLPKYIIGFTSSALITIDKIINNKEKLIELYFYELNLNYSRLSKSSIDNMYKKLIDNGVKKINL